FATVPLWAVRSGADPAGAGVVNGVLMLLTVLTQTVIPWALRRLGSAAVLTIGLLALGVPGPLYLISGRLGRLLLLQAVRGAGCGAGGGVRGDHPAGVGGDRETDPAADAWPRRGGLRAGDLGTADPHHDRGAVAGREGGFRDRVRPRRPARGGDSGGVAAGPQ